MIAMILYYASAYVSDVLHEHLMPCIQGVFAIRYGILGEDCHAVGQKADSFGCGRANEAYAMVANDRHADREERDCVPDALIRHTHIRSQPGARMNLTLGLDCRGALYTQGRICIVGEYIF